MELINNISQLKRALFIMMSLLMIAFVVSHHVIESSEMIKTEISQDEEEKKGEQEDETVFQAQQMIMLPGAALQLEPFALFFIRDLFIEEKTPIPFAASVPLEDTHYFKTLFRQIQSPNAP
jgi:hypothetical protein